MRFLIVITAFVCILPFAVSAQSELFAPGEALIEISDPGIGDPYSGEDGIITGRAKLDSIFRELDVFECRRIIPIAPNPEYRRRWRFTERWFKIIFDPKKTEVPAAVDMLDGIEGVLRVQPNYIFKAEYTPNDPYYDYQWHLPKIRANRVWDYTRGDSTIIVSGIDSGVDYIHPDLTNLIWQNLGEDSDGDGSVFIPGVGFDPDDLDSIDNDGNGYIDDLIGWDWVDRAWMECYRHPTDVNIQEDCYLPDNDPTGFIYSGHGTHVNGTIIAQTDNDEGVAGVCWHGKLMCLRAGYFDRYFDGYLQSDAVIQAISYGINMGCDVFNLSYGGYSKRYLDFDTTMVRYFLGEVIDSAVNVHGCIITASAGNDHTDTTWVEPGVPGDTARYHYPSTFPQTISVANTDIDDCKTWSSNYDSTIDISAPGDDIASTVPIGSGAAPGDPHPPDPPFAEWYGLKGGTSMSAPVVAGSAALLWSFYPDSSNLWIRSRLEDYAENIYPRACNIFYSINDRLGSGRVDVYRALGAGLFPQVTLEDFAYTDSDGDGRPEPGEDVSVVLTYSNTDDTIWAAATGAEVIISTDDSLVIITDSAGYFGDILTGASADNSADPFVFHMNPDFLYGRPVTFTATLRDDAGYVHTSEFDILIGFQEVLIATQDTESVHLARVTESMRFGGITYDSLIIPEDGLTLSELEKHRVVLLLSGNATGPGILPAALQDTIEIWLTDPAGDDRMFVLSGQDFPENADPVWLSDLFGAAHNIDSLALAYAFHIDGVPGDTLGDGIDEANIAFGSGSAGNQRRFGSCSATGIGIPCLYYDFGDLADSTCAVRFESPDGFKTVMMEFGIEGFGDSLRALFVQRIVEWAGMQYFWDVPEIVPVKPVSLEILPPFPNPFNSHVNIGFVLRENCDAFVRVFDISGREIRSFSIESAAAGPNFIRWDATAADGSRIPTGTYLYSVEAGGLRATGRLVFIK